MNEIRIKKPELLAPGGSAEGIRACIAAGADAVYTGGKMFGARAYAQNADEDTLKELIDLCHLYGKKLYLTVNTLLKEEELEGSLYKYLEPLYRHGLDAVLVQDLGVCSFIRSEFPDLPLHASTQMSVSSVGGARLLYELGFSRVVPARELNLEEISQIHREVPVEIETFIHGALCYSYSGQCLMSSMIGGRSGNRGRCAQPCRQRYEIDGKECFLMSLKDICTLEILPQILKAGVCSLKIEGRMKRTEYAAGVTAIYRRALDAIAQGKAAAVSNEDRRDLMDLYNRGGFSAGYYPGKKGPEMMAMDRPNHAGTPAIRILSGGRVKALEDLHKEDLLETQERGGSDSLHIAVDRDIPAGTVFRTGGISGLAKGTVLPRVRNEALLEKIRRECDISEKKGKIKGKLQIAAGKPVILEAYCERDARLIRSAAFGPAAEPARGKGMLREDYEKQIRRTGGTPFEWEDLSVEAEEGTFVPVSALNGLRREVLSVLEQKITDGYRRCVITDKSETEPDSGPREEAGISDRVLLTAECETKEQLRALLDAGCVDRIYADWELFADPDISLEGPRSGRIWLMLPPVWREDIRRCFFEKYPVRRLENFEGLLLRNWQQLGEPALIGSGRKIATDETVYTWNRRSRAFVKELGADFDTVPSELNRRELQERGCIGSEIPVYGREVMMTSAQCIRKNTAGCTKDNALLQIRDRYGKVFPVRCMCGICSNRIYNSLPLDLSGRMDEVLSLHPAGVRLRFTVETARETSETAGRFREILSGRRGSGTGEESTRGHFARGVE